MNKHRVLVVHNTYQNRGGEDSVVESEVELLRSYGHEVALYSKNNDDIAAMSRINLVGKTIWSKETVSDLQAKVLDFKPDVIHVHNTFPLISPSLYWAAEKANIPIIQTLHNFRLLCPQAMFLREGKVCEDCLGKIPWRGVMHGCYRQSKPQTAVLASMVTLHHLIGTWKNKVTRYIALNDFCRNKFIEGGLPSEKIVVKPNFVDFAAPTEIARSGLLFVGRLSAEKGVDVLVGAVRSIDDIKVRVAGVGPDVALVEGVKKISYLGALESNDIREEMSKALALILPSIWYENFPRTLVEAFGCGLPVIASRIGALAEIVVDGVNGLLFEPGDEKDLAEKIQWAHDNPEKMKQMGINARQLYEAEFTAKKNYQQLINIYDGARDEMAKRAF